MQPMRVSRIARAISRGAGFLRRQQHNWKVTVARTSISTFVYKTVFPYQSIYVVSLGATATQLGLVNTIGMVFAALLGPFTGWLIDRIGTKAIYLIGIGLLAASYFIYGAAQSWTILIVAMVAFWVGMTTSGHTCGTVCANSLSSQDRATGMSFCETVTQGLLGMGAPMFGALLVTRFGGVNVQGIRPLFFVSLIATVGTFLLILTQLSNQRWEKRSEGKPNPFRDLSQVFKQGKNLKRWIIITSVGALPMGMVFPFTQVFAHEVKGAEEYILGAMVTGSALTPLVLGLPFGWLADRIGRKRILYLMAPLFWASNLILILAPNPGFLILAGILQGSLSVSGTVAGAMTVELVPPTQMGRWLGLMHFFSLLLTAGGAYLAGAIWDHLGPHYLFFIAVGLDIGTRIPLLIGMPETLGLRMGEKQKEARDSSLRG